MSENIPIINNGILIINAIPSHIKMGHWILLYVKFNQIMYFDSFGMDPMFYDKRLIKYCNRYKNLIIANRKTIQSEKSFVCGAYCIYVCYKLSEHQNISKIISSISYKNKLKNDSNDFSFVMKLVGGNCSIILCLCL